MKRYGLMVAALLGAVLLLGPACSEDPGQPCDGGNCGPHDGDAGTDNQGGCERLCSVDENCCDGWTCFEGACKKSGVCPGGCNYECDKAAGERCDQGTRKCIQGAPPLNCQSDCNCFTGEKCDQGACVPACETDEDCEEGLECRDQVCRSPACASRADCPDAEHGCQVCSNQVCVAEPAVCASPEDCCTGRTCNFGVCTPEETGCQADSDCLDPAYPRCSEDGTCVPECLIDADCSAASEACIDHHCVPTGCTLESCPAGQWCDTTASPRVCAPGCDQNSDCVAPETCNYTTHACGTTDPCGNACEDGEYCDTFTGTCVPLCANMPACQFNDPQNCCPTNYTCNTETGRCMCTAAACPAPATCDPVTGQCVEGDCNPACQAGYTCVNGTCVPEGQGLDGDPCLADEDCNTGANYLCDGSVFCIGCMFVDETFFPEFVCREACSIWFGGCSNGAYTCKYRHTGLQGLCVP